MFYTLNKRTMVCNLILVVLMVALLVMQFLPFWHYKSTNTDLEPTEGNISIQQYIWLRATYKLEGVDKWFVSETREVTGESIKMDVAEANDLVTGPALGLFIGLFGIALCFFKNDKKYPPIFAAGCALANLYGYLTQPVLHLNPIWYAHLAIVCLILVVVVLTYILGRKENA